MTVDKLNILLKQPQKVFHSTDLAILWEIQNLNTLYTTVKRFTKKGVLFPIYKGLYSTLPTNQINPLELGVHILHRFCYVSTETILSQAGYINQPSRKYTYVSDISRNITYQNWSFISRQLQSKFLHNSVGISQNDHGILIASPERAVADMLYFQPTYHFDAQNLIAWDKVKIVQHQIGYI